MLTKIFLFLSSILGIFFAGAITGKKSKENEDLKNENEDLKNEIKIDQKISDMSFSNRSNFLLSKQKNNK